MKFKTLSALLLSTLLLGACGNEQPAEETAQQPAETEQPAEMEQPAEETAQQEEAPAEEENKLVDDNGNIILPNTIETDNAIYEIKDMRPGTADYTGEPILIIEMDYTNKQAEPTSPYMNFVMDFDVKQTDGTITTTLNGANGQMSSEDPQAVEMGDADVNQDAKVHAIIGYTLNDAETPVFFQFRFDPQQRGFVYNN